MKCTYRYGIKGTLKLANARPLRLRNMHFQFEVENGLAKAITIVSPIAEDEWPRFEQDKNTFHVNNVRMTFINMEIRGLQNILSLVGVEEIDTENWEISFSPENDAEREALAITQFKQTISRPELSSNVTIDHGVLTELVAASLHVELGSLDFPLSFYRKARRSMNEQQFIAAYYDFYFVLETLYGNGKTKNVAIAAEFRKSLILKAASQSVLDFSEGNFADQKVRAGFVKKYQGMDANALIEYLVKQRGFLHHHTARNRKIWHPGHQQEFEIDALMIQSIALQVLFEEVYLLIESRPVQEDLYRARQA